jgi:NADH-quinone oxidoreductase subunit M
MIAHGFVVVGLFSSLTSFFRRYETRTIAEMGGIRTQSPRFASMFLLLVLASVALPTTFNFVGEFTVLYSLSQINVWFAFFGRNDYHLGRLLHVENVPASNARRNEYKTFKDVTFKEGFALVVIIAVLFFFGMYPKPQT